MPVVQREDGLFDVHDYDTGERVLEGVPADYLPQELQDPYAGQEAAPITQDPTIENPWASPAIPASLDNQIDREDPSAGLPPEATAGPGVAALQPTQINVPAAGPSLPQFQSVGEVAPGGMAPPVNPNTPAPSAPLFGPSSAGAPGGVGGSPGTDPYAGARGANALAAGVKQTPYTKPGWFPSAKEFRPPLPEEIKGELAGAAQAQQQAATDLGAARGATLSEIGLAHAQRKEAADAQMADIQARQVEQENLVSRRMQVINARREELRDASKKFDPDKYWNDKGAFGTVLAKIGLALGDAGAALAGTKNGARESIEREIDRSIEGQRAKIDYLGEDLAGEYSILGEMQKNFQSRNAADLATRAVLNEAAAAHIDEIASYGGSTEAVAQGQATAADLRSQAATLQAQAYQDELGTVRAAYSRGGGGGTSFDIDRAYKVHKMQGGTDAEFGELLATGKLSGTGSGPKYDLVESQRKQRQDEQERKVRLPADLAVKFGTEYGFASSGPEGERTRQVIAQRDTLKQNYAKMRDMIAKYGTSVNDKTKGAYQTLVQGNVAAMTKLELLGAIAKADQEMVDPMTGRGGADIPQSVREFMWTSDEDFVDAQILQSNTHLDQRVDQRLFELYRDPGNTQPIVPSKPAMTPTMLEE